MEFATCAIARDLVCASPVLSTATIKPQFVRIFLSVERGCGMSSQSSPSDEYASESVVSFAPQAKDNSAKVDELDAAGRSILNLLSKAAGVAEENSRYALEQAQKLSRQLQAAETRITELENDVRYYADRAERAEQWFHKIYSEIEDRFIRQPQEKRQSAFRTAGRGQ